MATVMTAAKRDQIKRKRILSTVALATTLIAASCGSDPEPVAAPTAPASTVEPTTTTAPPTTQAPTTELTPDWELGEGTWVATAIGDGVESLDAPSSDAAIDWWFPSPTQFNGPRVFLVVDATEEYLEVMIPVRPNGATGWIRRDEVTLSEVQHRAEINLTTDSLTVWDGEEIIVETAAATGKPTTPTPLGEFFVRDVIESNPNGAYGSFILGLSGYSEALETFAGKEPAIAIHGTNRNDLVGQEVSNGCIRIPNELIELLAEAVPLGTPVTVVA